MKINLEYNRYHSDSEYIPKLLASSSITVLPAPIEAISSPCSAQKHESLALLSNPRIFRLCIDWKFEDVLAYLGEFVVEYFFDFVFSRRVLYIFYEIVLCLKDGSIDLTVYFSSAVNLLLDLFFGGALPRERSSQKVEEDED